MTESPAGAPDVMSRKGLVLYDYMAVQGGAEKLTQTLLDAWPGVDLCTAYIDRSAWPSTGSPGGQVYDLGVRPTWPVMRILQVIRAFERRGIPLDHYPWVLYSGMYAPMAVKNRSRNRNYLYCHTLPRFCFDLRDHYMRQTPWWARPLLTALVHHVTGRYQDAVQRMDLVIANSENVRQRLKKYLNQEAVVVHPPIDTAGYAWLGDDGYYVSLARLEDLKRVDVIIRAFKAMPEKTLVIASGGSKMATLKSLAADAPNIHFTGWVSDARLRELLGRARAAVYVPVDEDFGMSPVEAMAAGKPVIGVAEGGLLETILDGETGILIPEPLTPAGVCDAVARLESLSPSTLRHACQQQAVRFARNVFLDTMHSLLHPL